MDSMTFSIIIFMLISFRSTHILVVDASLNEADYFNGHALQGLNYLEDSREGRENHIEKVTGKEESEGNEPLILEKFRALLGLKSFGYGRTPPNGYTEYGSPSPSPLPTVEAEAPAPAPVQPITAHSHHHHHQLHRPRPIPQLHKLHKEDGDRGRLKRILLAVLVSAGVTIVLCTLGFIWVFRNFRNQRKQSKSSVSTYKSEGGTKGGSMPVNTHKPAEKVSSDPGLELFYIDSLETALEPQPFCLKQNPEAVNLLSNQSTSRCKMNEGEESEQGPVRSECYSVSCSAAKEITSVHESAESVKYESDGCKSSSGDKMVPAETQSDDDESFHSFCDSHSSNKRFSNASAGSLSERSEILSPKGSKIAPCLMTSPLYLPSTPERPAFISDSLLNPIPPHEQCNLKQISQPSPCSFNCPKGFTAPPPPPPPLPSLHFHISPSHSSSCSTRITSKALNPTLPVLSSPRNSDSSSGSNQTPPSDLPPSPPNPSRPSGTIPPPPCPPLLFRGKCNSPKRPPPPPPSQFPQFKLLGKDGAPLPKLKPLHWDKVRAAPDRSMVWDKLRSSSFEFDEEMIESLFGYNLQNSLKNDEAKSKSTSPSKHVLEPKRLQNLTILSKAVNLTVEQVCDALVQGEGLSLQQLEALVKMVPTKEEEDKLSDYKGDINELGSAERFVKAILNIPFAFSRIEAMLYRETFEDEVVHLRKSFLMLQEACEELRSSRLFLKLLEAVLKTGNRMNVGTIRGGAKAFKLDALLKLADVKGTDGRTTLLHFVVQEIVRSEGIRVSESIMGKINQRNTSTIAEEREEDYRRMGLDLVSGLGIELCNVKKTATIDLDVLASSVSNLSNGMAKLQHLVGKDLSMDESSGNFVHSIRSFLGYAERNIKELEEDEGKVLSHVREITEYFHGNVSKDEANPLRIFVIVRDFLCMLDHVCKELRSSKVPSSPNPLAPFR